MCLTFDVISELVENLVTKTLNDLDKSWPSIKYEVFFELVLQLPNGNGRCTLNECIESFLKPEKVDYKCPKCGVSERYIFRDIKTLNKKL